MVAEANCLVQAAVVEATLLAAAVVEAALLVVAGVSLLVVEAAGGRQEASVVLQMEAAEAEDCSFLLAYVVAYRVIVLAI